MKWLILLVLLAGCETSAIDQCLRREIYKECMDTAPKDDKEPWTTIMHRCSQLSEYQALRQIDQIKPECRP
jgi:hypothetical protein